MTTVIILDPNTPEYQKQVNMFAEAVISRMEEIKKQNCPDEWINSEEALKELGYSQDYGRVLKTLRDSGQIEANLISKKNILYSKKSIAKFKVKNSKHQ